MTDRRKRSLRTTLHSRLLYVAAALAPLCLAIHLWDAHVNAPPPTIPAAPSSDRAIWDKLTKIDRTAPDLPEDAWDDRIGSGEDGPVGQPGGRSKTPRYYRSAILSKLELKLRDLHAALAADSGPVTSQGISYDIIGESMAPYRLNALLDFAASVKAQAGDYVGASDYALDSIRLGLLTAGEGDAPEGDYRSSFERVGRSGLWRLVSHLTGDGAAQAERQLQCIESSRRPLAKTLTKMKWCDLRLMRNLFTSNLTSGVFPQLILRMPRRESTSGWFTSLVAAVVSPADNRKPEQEEYPSKARKSMPEVWARLLTFNKRAYFDREAQTWDQRIARSRLPYGAPYRRIPAPDDLGRIVDDLDDGANRGEDTLRTEMLGDAEARTGNGLLIVALALRAYQTQHADYPRSLDQLRQTGILASQPDDPFSPTVGRPFRYRRIDAGRYLLYSVGPDGVDNGGQPVSAASVFRTPGYLTAANLGDIVAGRDTPKIDGPLP